MEKNNNRRGAGRPKLNIDPIKLEYEISKYKNGEQKAITTYRNLKIREDIIL